jgi:hypothetical protein
VFLADIGHQILCSYTRACLCCAKFGEAHAFSAVYTTLITDFASPLALLYMPKYARIDLCLLVADSNSSTERCL